ncbi:MAG: dTDP-4-dehydrorhamnose reductase [Hyphomicrobiaceae bacterium]
MRLLITGWHGQVATALVSAAAARTDITALALGRPALDLCAPASIAGALADGRPDVIINTAAYTAVDRAEAEREAAHALNCEGARLIAREAYRRGAAIIHLSTDYVFDGTKPEPYVPSDPTAPINVYGETKLAGERAVAAENPRHAIVRTAWVYSPTGQNFLKTMLRLAEQRDEINVVADQRGSPTYAPHLAEALLDLAREMVARRSDDEAIWGTYHAAGSGEATWAEFAEQIFARSQRLGGACARVVPIPTTAYPTPARRPQNSRLDSSSFRQSTGRTLPDWREGVAECLEVLHRGRA